MLLCGSTREELGNVGLVREKGRGGGNGDAVKQQLFFDSLTCRDVVLETLNKRSCVPFAALVHQSNISVFSPLLSAAELARSSHVLHHIFPPHSQTFSLVLIYFHIIINMAIVKTIIDFKNHIFILLLCITLLLLCTIVWATRNHNMPSILKYFYIITMYGQVDYVICSNIIYVYIIIIIICGKPVIVLSSNIIFMFVLLLYMASQNVTYSNITSHY